MTSTTDSFRSPKKSRGATAARKPESALSQRLLVLVDLGLAGVIFVAPLFMGGRYDVGRLAYVACVVWAASSWVLRQCLVKEARWRWSGAEPLLLAGLLLLLFQLTPWPQGVLRVASPEIERLLPLWSSASSSEARMGTWSQPTLTPRATQGAVVTFLAHALLFLVAVQRLRDHKDIHRLLRWIALGAIGMAVLGLAQFTLGNGKFLWIYAHPSRDTFGAVNGTFQNQNHFAHFLILGLGPILWWLQQLWAGGKQSPAFAAGAADGGWQQFGKPALMIGLGLLVVAILLTFSRGGAVTASVAAAVCLGLLLRRGLLGRRSVAAFGGMFVILGIALAIHGYEPLAHRLSTLRDSESLEELSRGRAELWGAHLAAIPNFLWAGTGAGSHREVYKIYLEEDFGVEFTHGENGYLHLLLEMGVVGLALMVCAAGLAGWWALRSYFRAEDPAHAAAAAAVLAGLVASLVHSLGDFVWYIPACFSLTILLAACGCRLDQLTHAKAIQRGGQPGRMPLVLRASRRSWIVASALVLSVSTVMVMDRLPPALAAPAWDAYFLLSRADQKALRDGEQMSANGVAAMAGHLQRLLARDPYNARAHLRMAGLYLREFDLRQMQSENPLPLTQIRDAALASEFADRDALDRWLAAVIGEDRRWLSRAGWHARRALELCPLQGEGYVYLAELSFLQGAGADAKHSFVQQALAVRPFSGMVLLAAGGDELLSGDPEQGLALWKRAFHVDPAQQWQIIQMLASQMPPAAFVEQFEPDLAGLDALYRFYQRQHLLPQALEMAADFAGALVEQASKDRGEQAAQRWSHAASVFEFADAGEDFLTCAQKAVELAPDNFPARRALARAFRRNQQYEASVEQLQWCVTRQPADTHLQRELQTVNRLRIAGHQAQSP